MDLKKLEYILEIERTGSVSDAARRLDVTPSALVQHLQKLERELGTPLFHRTKGKWLPTQAGKIYMEYARQMLSVRRDAYRIINDITTSQNGPISIAFSSGRGVHQFAQIYPRFHSLYPGVRLQPLELCVRYQLELLRQRELDVGLVCLEKALHTHELQYFDVAHENLSLIVPAGHPLCSRLRDPVDIRDVAEEPFVVLSQQFTLRPIVDRIFQSAGVTPRILFESEHNLTIITMVQHGLCCGIVPEYYLYGGVPGIQTFHLAGLPNWHFYAVCPQGIYLSGPIRKLIQLYGETYHSHVEYRTQLDKQQKELW